MDVLCDGATWSLSDRIGDGGYGAVYRATDPAGRPAAVKLVPKEPGAERELLFANPVGARHVVPIIDQGQTREHWVLVMPLAVGSLAAEIRGAAPIPVAATLSTLLDIAYTLADLDGKVVHRDLKPDNVLLFDGNWCLADFGISRYAAASTAPDTRKHSLTPQYAAPERWRDEHATGAVDVYALGLIACELLTGTLPFPGPTAADYRHQHLHEAPPEIPGIPPRLAALIDECLTKAPEARPGAPEVLRRLLGIQQAMARTPSPGASQLAKASAAEVRRQSEIARAASQLQTEAQRRAALEEVARTRLRVLATELMEAVAEHADVAPHVAPQQTAWRVTLGPGALSIDAPVRAAAREPRALESSIDVIVHAKITVLGQADRSGYRGRAYSLWFCDAQERGKYGWYETAFMDTPGLRSPTNPAINPYALTPEQAAGALGNFMDVQQVAWPFTPLIAGELDEFIDRWLSWFASAANGTLARPMMMPERPPSDSWRN